MFKFPLFGKKKLLLAFEHGVILATTAQEQKVELTPAMVLKAEEMIENEFVGNSASHIAGHMEANILAVFETDMSQ